MMLQVTSDDSQMVIEVTSNSVSDWTSDPRSISKT